MTAEESLNRAEDLLARLEQARTRLEATDDPDQAIDILQELAELAKEVEAELQRAKRAAETEAIAPPAAEPDARPARELRELVEGYLAALALAPDLGSLEEPMRHALGGKRVRPVLCLATGDAIGAPVENLLPAAAAVELVHSFSLVHDDLPALDDDRERRGAPSVWAQYGEASAILAGDALLVEAMRLALTYPSAAVARELVDATLAMIGGQQLDLEGGAQLDHLHALKTGALFRASVMCALWAADTPADEHPPWRAFASDVGLLFQIVDDLLDGDGYVASVGEGAARRRADEAADRARAQLDALDADTEVLEEIVNGLAVRTT